MATGGTALPIHTDDRGRKWVLGNNPSPPSMVARAPKFGTDGAALIPRADWAKYQKEIKLSETPLQIKDQDGKGACNGHAAATALEVGRWVAGFTPVAMSAWWVYAILCNGIDRGSNILQALELCTTRGVAPEDDVAYGIINPGRLSTQAATSAARFKLEIGASLETWDEIVTSVIRDEPMNASICVGGNFNRLDANGVVGYTNGPGNHAVCFWGGLKEIGGGNFAVRFQNSWTPEWGDGGFGWATEQHFMRQRYMECYACRAVSTDPQDPNKMPDIG